MAVTNAQLETRMIQYLPNFYWNSKVLESIFRSVSPELTLFFRLTETQNSQSDAELTNYLNNDIGWGYERLINQLFLITANHKLDKFRDIFQVQTDVPTYRDLRSRLLLFSRQSETNTPKELENEIVIIGTVTAFVQDYANYNITITVFVTNFSFQEAVFERVNKIRPAHIGGTVSFYTCALDDSPPCELDDADAILGSSFSLS